VTLAKQCGKTSEKRPIISCHHALSFGLMLLRLKNVTHLSVTFGSFLSIILPSLPLTIVDTKP